MNTICSMSADAEQYGLGGSPAPWRHRACSDKDSMECGELPLRQFPAFGLRASSCRYKRREHVPGRMGIPGRPGIFMTCRIAAVMLKYMQTIYMRHMISAFSFCHSKSIPFRESCPAG